MTERPPLTRESRVPRPTQSVGGRVTSQRSYHPMAPGCWRTRIPARFTLRSRMATIAPAGGTRCGRCVSSAGTSTPLPKPKSRAGPFSRGHSLMANQSLLLPFLFLSRCLFELVDLDGAIREVCPDVELAAHRADEIPQRAHIHISSAFQLRYRSLINFQRIR
jgi:hypothetical protein